ncbi:MAG: sensor histidine kinase [Saprospiraceae bacterium]
MKKLFEKIDQFFLHQTVWMFLAMIGFASYILNEIFLGASFQAYFAYFISICFLFSPILIFSIFRNWLKTKFSTITFWTTWIICFIIYPIIIFSFNISISDFPVPINRELNGKFDSAFSEFVGMLLLVTEVAINSNDYIIEKLRSSNWFKKTSLEKGILNSLFLLAILLAATNITTHAVNPEPYQISDSFLTNYIFSTSYLTIQFSLVFLTYYFFYYANHYFLIPKLLKQRGVIYYGFGVAVTILLFYPPLGFLISWMPIAQAAGEHPTTFQNVNQIMNYGGIPFIVMFLSIPIILINQWFQQNAEISNLEKEKSETELNFLKQQINPHFFFNTLNNLYALSITKDEQTPEVILQLSELMRYVIYKGKEESVKLKEEIKYIEDYIQLQQIRLHKKLDFKFEKNISNHELRIPPLLFIVLVENAFKHGIEPSEKDCFLHLSLTSDEHGLVFISKNSFEEKPVGEKGIGLNNLKRRLELRFPDQHNLEMEETENTFETTLKISL